MRVLLIAGEASGDAIGAALMQSLRRVFPASGAEIGPKMTENHSKMAENLSKMAENHSKMAESAIFTARRRENVEFFGVGGGKMQAMGLKNVPGVEFDKISVVGFVIYIFFRVFFVFIPLISPFIYKIPNQTTRGAFQSRKSALCD
jgi:lipid A disaccharide synthetase